MTLERPDSPVARLDDNASASPFSGVVSLSTGSGVYSGVLVARRHVLTAAHVVPTSEEQIRVNFNVGGDLTHRVPAARVQRHPQFNGIGNNRGAYDLAVVELSSDAPEAARTYMLAPTVARPGLWLQLVGYGASGPGSRGVLVGANPALRRLGSNRITELDGDGSGGPPRTYRFVFARPEGSRIEAVPRGYARPTGLASGDSGSPAFVLDTSTRAWLLFGINTMVMRSVASTGPAFGYGTVGGGQIVLAHVAWLRSMVPRFST